MSLQLPRRDYLITGLLVAGYWLALFLLSLRIEEGEALQKALPYLTAGALPLLGLAGMAVWRAARTNADGLAYRDELTEIGNRRAFLRQAQAALQRAQPGSLSLLVLDVDGLKDLNDVCGHQAGDELLLAVTRRLSVHGRNLYRIGGDEFAVLVDRAGGASLTSILSLLEPFSVKFTTCGHQHSIGLSFGYAANQAGDSLDALFNRADICLLQYKSARYSKGELPNRRGLAKPTATPARTDIPSLEQRRTQRGARA